jgi:hypothetical protein
MEPGSGGMLEKALGKEDKLVSASSLRVSGGKQLTVRHAVNLRMLPRALVGETAEADFGEKPEVVEKK